MLFSHASIPSSRDPTHHPTMLFCHASIPSLRDPTHHPTQACIRIDPKFPKGHFRLALAQQALEQFGDACTSFNKVLDLEPNNKDAASGLNMARMQAERRRRQAAGVTS